MLEAREILSKKFLPHSRRRNEPTLELFFQRIIVFSFLPPEKFLFIFFFSLSTWVPLLANIFFLQAHTFLTNKLAVGELLCSGLCAPITHRIEVGWEDCLLIANAATTGHVEIKRRKTHCAPTLSSFLSAPPPG